MSYHDVCFAETLLRGAGYVHILRRCGPGFRWSISVRRSPDVWPHNQQEATQRFHSLGDVRDFLLGPIHAHNN